MTEAERKLIDALVDAKDLRIHTMGFDALDIHEALRVVARERVPPEAKEKFLALHARYKKAQEDLHAYSATLPSSIVMQWWNEKP